MDRLLLELFVNSARDLLLGGHIGEIRWYRPVLSLQIKIGRNWSFLVAILETPGPFCFLSSENPLRGLTAPKRFSELSGAKIADIQLLDNDRVVRIDAVDAGNSVGGELRFLIYLYGSFGRIELLRSEALLHRVGGRAPSSPRATRKRPGTVTPDSWSPEPGEAIYLLSRKRLGRVAPTLTDDETAVHRFGPFDDALTGCGEVGKVLLIRTHERMVEYRLKPISRLLTTRKRLLDNLRTDLENASGHEKLRRETETLAAYQARIPAGTDAVDLPDIYDPAKQINFELDPSVSIQSQIEKRFKRAAKLSRSDQHIRRRIVEVSNEIERLSSAIDEIRTAGDFAGAMNLLERLYSDVPGSRTLGAGPLEKKPSTRPGETGFRRFDLDKTWFVLVGRNNKENDSLTFHSASPTDLWFHAQHVSGSHVVLKSHGHSGSPPGHILEKTASIAAYYSKARHSALVPVMYTQRKYVRKPKGAKPGQVLCEREKMIMVEPVLPEKKE